MNPVLAVRKRYLRRYNENDDGQADQQHHGRQKQGVNYLARKDRHKWHELVELNVSDVDLIEMKIGLKPTAKRTNRTVFFDDEAAFALRRWMKIREGMNKKSIQALFLNADGERLNRSGVYNLVVEAARRVGLHNSTSDRLEDHFGPHCCRHWFCTHLFRNGIRRSTLRSFGVIAGKKHLICITI